MLTYALVFCLVSAARRGLGEALWLTDSSTAIQTLFSRHFVQVAGREFVESGVVTMILVLLLHQVSRWRMARADAPTV